MKLIDLNLNVDEQIIKLIIENLADEKFNEFGLTDWKFCGAQQLIRTLTIIKK
jgi:hypothetical protein